MFSKAVSPAQVEAAPAAVAPVLVAAILSDHPEAAAAAARASGIHPDCADAATLWLLPSNAPDILLVDLPVAGATERRIALLIRQLARACPDLVIAIHDPQNLHPGLSRDIDVTTPAEAFAEALHLLQPRLGPTPLFFHKPPKRRSLFR